MLQVEYLVVSGADIDASDNIGETPICKAPQSGNIQAVEFLIKQGASVDLPQLKQGFISGRNMKK